MRWWSAVAAAVVVVVQVVEAARILMLAPIVSTSHGIFFTGIAEALAARNHTVTYLTGLEASKPRRNIHEVFVPGVNVLKNLSNHNFFHKDTSTIVNTFAPYLAKCCADALSSKEMQKVQEEEFALVIMYILGTECFYPYVYNLQEPYIHMSPNVLYGTYSDQAGNPHFSSLVVNRLLGLEYPLTFTGRMINALGDIVTRSSFLYYLYPRVEEECRRRQLWPENAPSLAEMRFNGSLFIVNSVQTLETPAVPYVPTVVHAGGIHCRPSQPLPQELEEWVAGAGDAGFIYFSLGTTVMPSFMPEKYRTILLQVFASLEQRVLWKWDQDTMDDLPPNVRLSKWLPQQDILGDPRLRLFITHGGLLSTQEATYHGVPLLGLPVFVDQHTNTRQVQREGWGRLLPWEDLTLHTLRHHILHLTHDPGVREKALWRSAVMRDQPMTPGRWMTYWVEYVLRHRGAHHLRCPASNMPWYELYNVDVWLVMVVMVVIVVTVVMVLAGFLTSRFLVVLYSCFSSLSKPKRD